MRRLGRAVAVCALAFCAAAPAGAQTPASPPESPAPRSSTSLPRLQGMFTVYVRDHAGVETKGKLVSLTDALVVLDTGTANQTINLSDVSRIYRRGDSVKTGLIVGAVLGAISGAAITGGCETSASRPNRGCGPSRVAFSVVSAGIWAAMGAGIDALIPGRTLIWKAPSTVP